ncbi:hypothetical protein Tco_0468017 [Tanacetum coccineum]
MDLETTQTNAIAKLPILKQGEYEMWRLTIEQYFQIQDYALWDVIENGNSFKPTARTTSNADGTSTSMIPGPVTTEEKAQKKNDVKARSMLLMALPSEHQLTFNQYKDAKTLFDAIQTRFGGNDATRKTQKTLLKQIHVVVWRNKSDLDTMSIDDLYNNFKIIEQEVKRTVTSSSNSNSSSQNMVFVSSLSSTNEVNIANLASLSMRARRYFQRTGRKITINGSDTAGYDKSKLKKDCECGKTSSKAMVAIDEIGFDWSFMADEEVPTNMAFSDSEKNEVMFCDQIVVLKRDTSFKDSEINALKSEIEKLKKEKERLFVPPTIDLSNSGLEEFQQPEFEGYGPKAIRVSVKIPLMRLRKLLMPHWANSAVVNAVKANQVNAVKASTCLVWRPTKLNSASITFKRHNYIDARGRSKSVIAWAHDRQLKRGRDTKIPQSSGLPEKVGDEAVHKELGERMERAGTTASSLEAEQDSGSGPRCQDTKLGDVDAQTRIEVDIAGYKHNTASINDDEPQPSSNAENKDDEGVSKASGFSDQEQPERSTPNINTAGPRKPKRIAKDLSDPAWVEAM